MNTYCQTTTPPRNKEALLDACKRLEGMRFRDVAHALGLRLPLSQDERKGWLGMAVEKMLGADAGSRALPDFTKMGIELKTIPLGKGRVPRESTFITSIPLRTLHLETWETSTCRKKLQHILWLPIEGLREIPFSERRIGEAKLWVPNNQQEMVLKRDWTELTTLIATGYLETIDARIGEYLQIRPKAAHSRVLCKSFDKEGHDTFTLPRGFYLRTSFTRTLF